MNNFTVTSFDLDFFYEGSGLWKACLINEDGLTIHVLLWARTQEDMVWKKIIGFPVINLHSFNIRVSQKDIGSVNNASYVWKLIKKDDSLRFQMWSTVWKIYQPLPKWSERNIDHWIKEMSADEWSLLGLSEGDIVEITPNTKADFIRADFEIYSIDGVKREMPEWYNYNL